MALYKIDPWGEGRADLRAGIISSTLANVNRGPKSQPLSPIDFMPYHEKPEPPNAQAELSEEIKRGFMQLEKAN